MIHIPISKNSAHIDLGNCVAYLMIQENTGEILAVRFSNIVKHSNTKGALLGVLYHSENRSETTDVIATQK